MTNTVFVVMRNSDMTAGRGPMVLDSIWDNENEVTKYVRGNMPYNNEITKDTHGHFIYGAGWYTVDKVPVFSDFKSKKDIEDSLLRAKTLAKLSEDERRVLGLE